MADYAIGSVRVIQWYDVIGYVTINLSRDNGSTWEHIIEHQPSVGEYEVPDTYNWTVTGPTATTCLIRIIDENKEEKFFPISDNYSLRQDNDQQFVLQNQHQINQYCYTHEEQKLLIPYYQRIFFFQ